MNFLLDLHVIWYGLVGVLLNLVLPGTNERHAEESGERQGP